MVTDNLTNFEEPHFPVQIWIPWNVNGFWSYTAAAIFELFISVSACLLYATCGAFQFTFTYQMSAYLKVLQNRLINNGPTDKSIYQQHNTLNQFLLDYIDIHSANLFVEITLASIMPCGFGYTIIKGFKNNIPPQLHTYHRLILGFIGPILMYSCGQEISDQMQILHESTYFSKWYEEKPKVRRDLYTMMLVTVRPVTINYKLFITIDMKCGTTIVQGIYSYLMMINNFETAD
ncbi:hypothetical protein O3M35_009783 [Rhynocoris fuscipes]|uniref:Uncharacterized protein n=1 Tax=Rhynocoris fuscipes TaxID=488301 RepID=A0AAW1D725_9HEMI